MIAVTESAIINLQGSEPFSICAYMFYYVERGSQKVKMNQKVIIWQRSWSAGDFTDTCTVHFIFFHSGQGCWAKPPAEGNIPVAPLGWALLDPKG